MSNFNNIYHSILTEGRIPSIFKKATPEELAERAVQYEKMKIQKFLERNDVKKNWDGSYDVDGDVDFSNWKTMTRLPIRFGEVGGWFDCSGCTSLTTLEGVPNTVDGNFCCSGCTSITSLEGAPNTVGGYFSCSYCTSLTSLEGVPNTVGSDFYCRNTGRKFTIEEVRNHCKVKGDIYV